MDENNPAEFLRLFVAIRIPDAARENIIRAQHELQPLPPHGAVRWAKPEQFHLTLRFLGDVSSNRVVDLRKSVSTVCADVPILRLRAKGIGFFPHPRSPRVIWVGVKDDEGRLAELQGKIEDAVRPFTTERENERFAGHVTLGRFRQYKLLYIKELMAQAGAMEDRLFGEWTARKIEIIRSELSPAGARYTTLEAFPLH